MNNQTDGYYVVVVEGEKETVNRTVIKSDIQFFTIRDGYNYSHSWQRAKKNAEAIAFGLNNFKQL
jgi:hypothetical protein